ncbi:MAG TPA: DoxX family protein [Mycobacteriales bacterium]|nr:DoxX family protein [Mycobacteriales bacterium]
MHTVYLVVTVLAALATGYAATLSLSGAESVKTVAARVRVPTRCMVPFGLLLASGAVGLLAGLAVPVLGVAAAAGLIGYFICAVGAHVRVRDRGVGGAAFFLALMVVALLVAVLGGRT